MDYEILKQATKEVLFQVIMVILMFSGIVGLIILWATYPLIVALVLVLIIIVMRIIIEYDNRRH